MEEKTERPKRIMNYESTSLGFLQYVDKLEAYANKLEEKINYTCCCESDSELLHGVEVLCYFQDICRVGYWDEELERWVIHSDGVKRYYKFIDKHLPIPK